MTKITFDRDTCGRCGGTGRMPFSVHGGVCFACGGSGLRLSRSGRAAHKRFEAWAATALDRLPLELQAGDVVKVPPQFAGPGGGLVTFKRAMRVLAVRPAENGMVEVDVRAKLRAAPTPWTRYDAEAQVLTFFVGATSKVRRSATAADLIAVAPTLGKGATLIQED